PRRDAAGRFLEVATPRGHRARDPVPVQPRRLRDSRRCDSRLRQYDEMSKVEFEDGAVSIDATVVAEGFGLSTDQIRHLMRTLKMTTRCERGIDADAGRHRLTFLY